MTITWDPDAPFRLGGARATAAEARRLRAAGLIRLVLGDVVVSAHREDSREVRAAAAGLLLEGVLGETRAVAYSSAAWVHVGTPPPDRIEIGVPHGSHRPGVAGVRVRQVALHPGDVQVIAGVRVTTATRTAADVARDLPPDQAPAVLNGLREVAGVQPRAVLDRLRAMPKARNVVAAQRLVSEWASRGELTARRGDR